MRVKLIIIAFRAITIAAVITAYTIVKELITVITTVVESVMVELLGSYSCMVDFILAKFPDLNNSNLQAQFDQVFAIIEMVINLAPSLDFSFINKVNDACFDIIAFISFSLQQHTITIMFAG